MSGQPCYTVGMGSPMSAELIIHRALASLDSDGGFTLNIATGQAPDGGYAVSEHPEASAELDDVDAQGVADYVIRHASLLAVPGNHLGGWRDPDTRHVWLDVTRVEPDYDTAVDLAHAANQIAIFNLSTGETINTGGTGADLAAQGVAA